MHFVVFFQNHMRLTNGSLRLGPLEFSTQFCVTAHAESQSLPLAYKRSEQMCTETPKGTAVNTTPSAREGILCFHFQIVR